MLHNVAKITGTRIKMVISDVNAAVNPPTSAMPDPIPTPRKRADESIECFMLPSVFVFCLEVTVREDGDPDDLYCISDGIHDIKPHVEH